MKIQLEGSVYSPIICGLAEACAREVHGRMINLHLSASAKATGERDASCSDLYRIDECRRLVRSIHDKLDRRYFVWMIREHLDRLCRENGTHRRTRDYVAAVIFYRKAA